MMGPEAALVSARIADLRALGGYVGPRTVAMGPMYAEVAARVHLEPFEAPQAPAREPGVWARILGALRHSPAKRAEPRPDWTVAAAPIVEKGVPGREPAEELGAALLAGLPLLAMARRP